MSESLEDHLRRATRNFTTRLPEDQVFALGRSLAAELARAHAEVPPRYPDIDPARIEMGDDGQPRLPSPGATKGRAAEGILALGALLHQLATGSSPDVSWRLDGPPPAEASTLRRRAVLATLASPGGDGFATAAEAESALARANATEAPPPPPWPLFRGAPTRVGSSGDATSLPQGLGALWQIPLGAILASPLLTADLAIVATADGRLVLLDRARGTLVYETKIASASESSPALNGRAVLLGTDDGELLAVDAIDGRIAYRVKLGEVVRSSPLPQGDRVFVGAVEGKGLGALLALDAANGKTVWKRKLGPVFSSPALAGGLVLVGSDDESLHAVDAQSGALAWSRPLSARVRATPAVLGDVAVVGDFKGRVAAVKTTDGTLVWSQELGQPVYSSAALTPALCVVGCHDGHVYGLSLATGERVFDVATGGPVVSSPTIQGAHFLAASTDGQLYLFDATGRTLGRLNLGTEGIQSSPALDATGGVIGSGRGLHAFGLTS
ncbi:MAG TPA: PQQ-binding-like beta-propeller repeat protein [Vicinamibacteria bacterium]|nr:PQQ-binding-like beta-propeller repeat protein [Vicinamibacteria bacterium]